MDVKIYHEGIEITSHVISYDREHLICTGVGQLSITIERTIGRTFNPWDSIDIYENGDFKVSYYVSGTSDSIPDGTIVLQCQDMSKRLIDYFIPDQYTVEEPSYTRYWIEKFLDEAGIDYSFLTGSQGNLLSNFTTLGLSSAYDQIITLLQLSGWFMYFDGTGTAVIGTLDKDLAQKAGSFDSTDIIEIDVVSHDKMLRNRAVVWGAFDPLRQKNVYADVSTRTKWNYDSKDKRAVVISNSNIPNASSAYAMANQLVKEFSKITVEKHITLTGARDLNLGDIVNINTRAYRGSGMITTFGVSMSATGLTTKIILDERCPRLFGFYNFGDYVYVSTYGSGIWRKHIQYLPDWYDFSSGLTNLNIVDLHINNGVFGSVGASGEMFYANSETGPWGSVNIESLDSSSSGILPSSQDIEYKTYSGIFGKAIIVDKTINTIKYAASTNSGITFGDYFLDSQTIISGYYISCSGNIDDRSWIVECNPFTGQPVGGLGSGIYPVHYSGNYDITILDIENDGSYDYVSVFTSNGSPGFPSDLGQKTSSLNLHDFDNRTGGTPLYSGEVVDVVPSMDENYVAFFNNELDGASEVVYKSSNKFVLRKVIKTYNVETNGYVLSTSSLTSPSLSPDANICGITKVSDGLYKAILYTEIPSLKDRTFYYALWSTSTNTLTPRITLNTVSFRNIMVGERYGTTPGKVINGYYYYYRVIMSSPQFVDRVATNFTGPLEIDNKIEVSLVSVNLSTSLITVSSDIVFDFDPGFIYDIGEPGTDYGTYTTFFYGSVVKPPLPLITQKNNLPEFILPITLQHYDTTEKYSYFIVVSYLSPKTIEAQNGLDPNFINVSSQSPNDYTNMQLTESNYVIFIGNPTQDRSYIYYNGSYSVAGSGIVITGNYYPMFGGNSNKYIQIDGSSYTWRNPLNFSYAGAINLPSGYTGEPYSNIGVGGCQIYWSVSYSGTSYILTTDSDGDELFKKRYSTTITDMGIICGNFFVNIDRTGFDFNARRITYYDNSYPHKYMVLQRDGSNYNLVQTDNYPIRLDISNFAPLLTVTSGENSFVSSYINDQSVSQTSNIYSTNLRQVDDYRYALLETALNDDPTISGVINTAIYVSNSGIYGRELETYSGDFQQIYVVPSGYGYRVETSNYGVAGQYVFVVSSGDAGYQAFYQKDPTDFLFVEYSGLPDVRATRIRLDDRL